MPDVATQTDGFTLTLNDGSVVKAANAEEAVAKIAKMKEDTAAELQRTRSQLDEANRLTQAAREAEAARQSAARQADADKNGQFSAEKYYTLLGQDPAAANDYYFECRFGAKPDELARDFQSMRRSVTTFEQQAVSAAFLAQHADFPATSEAAKLMRERAEVLVSAGSPFNSETLERAYYQLVNEEKIKPTKPAEDDKNEANPSLRGGGGGDGAADLSQVDRMDDKALEALLRGKGMLR